MARKKLTLRPLTLALTCTQSVVSCAQMETKLNKRPKNIIIWKMKTYFSKEWKYCEMSTMDAFNCSNCNLKYETKVDDHNVVGAAAANTTQFENCSTISKLSRQKRKFNIILFLAQKWSKRKHRPWPVSSWKFFRRLIHCSKIAELTGSNSFNFIIIVIR